MRRFIALLALLSLAACSYSESTKKMTLKGKAVTGVTSRHNVATGRVSLVVPGPQGWQRVVFRDGTNVPNIVTTASDGTFTFTVEYNWWDDVFKAEDRPVFLAVTDSTGTFSLLDPVPIDQVAEDAELTLNPSPETTVASLWQCPGGVFSSPQPSCPSGAVCSSAGGYPCYELPQQSTTTSTMVNAIDAADSAHSIAEPANGDWASYSTALLNADPTLLDKILANLAAKGFHVDITLTPDFIASAIGVRALPIVPVPTADDANSDTSGTSGQEFCSSYASCTTCSISACSDGENSYYKTSSGATYQCASTSNCTSAASQVVAACCSRSAKSAAELFDWLPAFPLTRAR